MTSQKTSEAKRYSITCAEDKFWNEALEKSSRSKRDAVHRRKVYQKVYSNLDNVMQEAKTYSGYAEIPLLSNQYFNATMASYVRSFAGFLTIERDMDQPNAMLYFLDLIGVIDKRAVLPNLGKEDLTNINARFQASQIFVPGQTEYSLSTSKKLIPGSIKIDLVHAANPKQSIRITDDHQGTLTSPAGYLAANTDGTVGVNYDTGVITFTLGSAFSIAPGDSFFITGFEDVAGSPEFGTLNALGNNRFTSDMKSINVTAEPDTLFTENNIMTIAAMKKALGTDPQDITGSKLTELYTKLVNQKIVNAIINSWSGDVVEIPTNAFINKFLDFNSRLDAFQGELVNIDTELAKKSIKAVAASAYIVGEKVGNWFKKLVNTGKFVDNTGATYINDLLGYYKGIPVLRHTDIGINEGYAIHKTPDGLLAPVIRGIFLPLTNTPVVENYHNPTQFSTGVYYQEATEPIVPELVQKFTIDPLEV